MRPSRFLPLLPLLLAAQATLAEAGPLRDKLMERRAERAVPEEDYLAEAGRG